VNKKRRKKMTKEFKVVLSYDVQRTFIIQANNEEEAYDKAYNGQGDIENDDWEYRDHIETKEENNDTTNK
jgi:hypothetical protein